ncbi:uncharacterized protein TRIVIDRAFT_62602 [Trichoderma virens Gv29-8]|uniref:Uncharacterized protein n=1 Tax=Hypocrea virens (strain Gv29-8 / FGSC 10586) TaxID=413071 RepID=G9MDV1_HYPVG|nr:uncharacterized protein TRIVIDRAFT_62602 [Trichoderma virens Gv29-8]EHK26799.1 hypothetical protein TRIVIDRAFT_62602 [Trichoderma virens Gv29-8]UKZ57253.1 hypothetical protein TrVGV298_011106 [Trichoderma virens]
MPRFNRVSDTPIVTIGEPRELNPPDETRRREEFKRLIRGYKRSDSINVLSLAVEDQAFYCKTLVKGVFEMVGVDHNKHTPCYQACVEKCVLTRVLEAQNWSGWGGYRDFTMKLSEIARHTMFFKVVHIMNAPSVVAAIAVKKLRHVDTNGKDDVSSLLTKAKTFEYAHASIQVWKPTHKVIRTDRPYDGLPLVDNEVTTLDEDRASTEDGDEDIEVLSMADVQQTRNQAQLMLEVQQFEEPRARPRTPTPPPPIVRKTEVTMTRQYNHTPCTLQGM